MSKKLQGKVAVITGGNSGIGLAHRLGPVAVTRLLAAERRTRKADFSCAVVYGYTEVDPARLGQAERAALNAGGFCLHAPQQHAKVVVCDDFAYVSSYNFLSADPFQTASGARKVGVVLEGPEPVRWLADRLLPMTSS
jgi:NAD(P)-dependent dehydrogenase (short-subunit alcohol dehydrogenase family)